MNFNLQMHTSFLYEINSTWIAGLLMVAMLIVSEVGYRLGRRFDPPATDASRSQFLAVKGSILGLLALLLAFTFNLASQRYEMRQRLVVDESNMLHDIYMRSTLLPEPQQSQFFEILNQYVDVRLKFFSSGRDLVQVNDSLVQGDALQTKMWETIKSVSPQDPSARRVDAMFQDLSQEWTLQRDRLYAFQNNVPEPVIVLVLGCALVALSAVGFTAGLAGNHAVIGRLLIAFVLAGTIHIILDLDRPRRGLIQVSQEPMQNLNDYLDSLPKPAGK